MTFNDLKFSQHVINTIKSLPIKERIAVSMALTCEFILGEDPRSELSPFENQLYSVIRQYVAEE